VGKVGIANKKNFPKWSSRVLPSTNDSILFTGEAGEALLILKSGEAFRDRAFDAAQKNRRVL
jgi:hypothetical protein